MRSKIGPECVGNGSDSSKSVQLAAGWVPKANVQSLTSTTPLHWKVGGGVGGGDGADDGAVDGLWVGLNVGDTVGANVVGIKVGATVGVLVGPSVGDAVGECDVGGALQLPHAWGHWFD